MFTAPDDFASLPAAIARELEGRSRVVVVLLDAFGWSFVQRHAQHPLLARVARDGVLAPMASQFPSTTTAHVTTMHTGLPVEAHGLYEWRVWEPALGRVIVPLTVGDAEVADGFDPRALLPEGPSFYQRLAVRAGVGSVVFSPGRFSPSTYDGAAVRGARLVSYGEWGEGMRAVADEVAGADPESKTYAYAYWDGIDMAGHRFGPSSAEFDDACLRALDGVYTAFFGPQAPAVEDTLLVLTADHGQIDVSPDDVVFIDELLPAVRERLTAGPAGSARDLFLHVAEPDVDATVAELTTTLGDLATVHRSSELFSGTIGPRLTARLAPICILPRPGQLLWLSSGRDDIQLKFRGHHGGRTPEESTTFVGALELG